MPGQLLRGLSFLIAKEEIMYLPVFSWIARAVGCFMRFEGLGMERGDGKVAEDIADRSGSRISRGRNVQLA